MHDGSRQGLHRISTGAGQNVPMPKRTQPKRTQFWSKRTHFFGQNVPSPPKRTQPFGQNVPNIFFSYL